MMEAVTLCLQGSISPQVAISRMLLGGADAADIRRAVADARPLPVTREWRQLAKLVDGRSTDLNRLAAEIQRTGSDHSAMGGIAGIAHFFDRAVGFSPEASVALYSLGDRLILDAATDELVAWLSLEAAFPPMANVLDLGCGIGRIAAALAPRCQKVLGVDISAGMITEARRRHGGVDGLHFEVAQGDTVPQGPFDLVLMVDSMPYIHQVGLADRMMAQATAALTPGGTVIVLNISYGRPVTSDRQDAERWAKDLQLTLAVSRPFKLWDGTAFVFRSRT
jgi:SAM-dependent methyltransferase